MTTDPRDALKPCPELAGVADVLAEGEGVWRPCSGCHETNEGYETGHFAFSAVFSCYVGTGCRECGGLGAVWDDLDYADMAQEATAHLTTEDLNGPVPECYERTLPWATAVAKGLIRLRTVIGLLRETGNFSDEEGEDTNDLEDLLKALEALRTPHSGETQDARDHKWSENETSSHCLVCGQMDYESDDECPGDNLQALAAPKSRQECAALAREILAELGNIGAHIEAAIARCEEQRRAAGENCGACGDGCKDDSGGCQLLQQAVAWMCVEPDGWERTFTSRISAEACANTFSPPGTIYPLFKGV